MTTTGRLRGRRTFADLAREGRTVRSGPLRVRYLAAPGNPSVPAVGYAIGKRVGNAVVRNRVRRRLRAAVSQATLPLTSGFILISADVAAATAPLHELVVALERAANDLSAKAAS